MDRTIGAQISSEIRLRMCLNVNCERDVLANFVDELMHCLLFETCVEFKTRSMLECDGALIVSVSLQSLAVESSLKTFHDWERYIKRLVELRIGIAELIDCTCSIPNCENSEFEASSLERSQWSPSPLAYISMTQEVVDVVNKSRNPYVQRVSSFLPISRLRDLALATAMELTELRRVFQMIELHVPDEVVSALFLYYATKVFPNLMDS